MYEEKNKQYEELTKQYEEIFKNDEKIYPDSWKYIRDLDIRIDTLVEAVKTNKTIIELDPDNVLPQLDSFKRAIDQANITRQNIINRFKRK